MKLQLKRSNVLEGGAAKQPAVEQMEYGELAVNYNSADPSIFIKNSDNEIITIATPAAPDVGETLQEVCDNGNVTTTGATFGGDVTANAFIGDGSQLTNLPIPAQTTPTLQQVTDEGATTTLMITAGGYNLGVLDSLP